MHVFVAVIGQESSRLNFSINAIQSIFVSLLLKPTDDEVVATK